MPVTISLGEIHLVYFCCMMRTDSFNFLNAEIYSDFISPSSPNKTVWPSRLNQRYSTFYITTQPKQPKYNFCENFGIKLFQYSAKKLYMIILTDILLDMCI
jgi:hypothetical protein